VCILGNKGSGNMMEYSCMVTKDISHLKQNAGTRDGIEQSLENVCTFQTELQENMLKLSTSDNNQI
jgi:hypothetical protein